MNCSKILGVSLVITLLFPLSVGASTLTAVSGYDQKSGVLTIAISAPFTPSSPYNIEMDVRYEAAQTLFRSINFGQSSAVAVGSSTVNGQGQISASASNIVPDEGHLLARMAFTVSGSGSFNGEAVSIKINGTEYGPLTLPTTTTGPSDTSSNPTLPILPTLPVIAVPVGVPPSEVIAMGMNHAVKVMWTHPVDGVVLFRVDAHQPDSGMSASSSPILRGCVARAPASTCTVRGLRNGAPLEFAVTAIYPDGTSKTSDFSNAATPARLHPSGLFKGP